MRVKNYKTKLLAISLAASLVFQPMSFAAPVAPVAPTVVTPEELINNPSLINLPFNCVSLKEVRPGSKKLIIHIQDAHANYSGQMNMAKAIRHLTEQYGLNIVLVEGSSKDVTLDTLREAATLKEWKKAGKRFLMDGVISGEEYLNLTSTLPLKLKGIEYQALYNANLTAYAKMIDYREKVDAFLINSRRAVDRLKSKFYNDDLIRLDESSKGIESGETTFKDKILLLQSFAADAGINLNELYAQIEVIHKLQADESRIDFDSTNKEQLKLLSEMRKVGAGEAVDNYLEQQKSIKNAHIAQYNILNNLLKQASVLGINID